MNELNLIEQLLDGTIALIYMVTFYVAIRGLNEVLKFFHIITRRG